MKSVLVLQFHGMKVSLLPVIPQIPRGTSKNGAPSPSVFPPPPHVKQTVRFTFDNGSPYAIRHRRHPLVGLCPALRHLHVPMANSWPG